MLYLDFKVTFATVSWTMSYTENCKQVKKWLQNSTQHVVVHRALTDEGKVTVGYPRA